ncbi:MAG: hypothetical protein HC825_08805 [Oscillatoriales cyanobacterium RM1_1_9]|nr:hypothetical protein [Oscillatoriales cyanobacterium RM1_1_9]
MVELANQTGIDPWFTLPHLATDEYIENFAQYVEDNLNPNLDIYIEYSNEVWNSGLNQTRYAQAQGSQQFPDAENLAEATRYWYTQRTIEMAQIWDEVFGQNKDRVTGVVGTQVANDLLATQSLEYIESTGLSYEEAGIDAIGVAPYFRLELRDQSNVSAIEGWVQQGQDFALDQLFKEITVGGVMPKGYPGGSLQRPIDMVTSHLALTEPRGLDLIAYEGGQSVAPLQRGGMENNKALADLFIAANRDPRMGDVYKQYLNTWDELTGDDLFVHFSDVSTYSKFGSWGSRESIYQESSPKYDAIQQVIGNHSGPGNPPPEPDPDLDKDNNLTGTPGNDVIISGAGNDRISAGAGDDVLIGVNDQNINPGLGEQDRLKGDAGADTFVLGNSTKVFYKDNSATISGGWKGRAVIVDFSSGEDRIQLSASGNYQLEVAQNSTRIFEISGLVKDVIGVVNNTTDLNLQNLDQFVFV